MDLQLYIPKKEDEWFYAKMMTDPETMAYNAPWFPPDGCIPNPEEGWENLISSWVGCEDNRFYAFLQRTSDGCFVGDVNYHYNPKQDWYDMGIVIYAPERAKGYGKQGLQLLLDRAFRVNGISKLHNEFEATRDAALRIHKAVGFQEVGVEDGQVQLEITCAEYLKKGKQKEGNNMHIELSRFRVKKGKSEVVDQWLTFLNENVEEVLLTLAGEKMYIETIFREKSEEGEYLYWYSIQGEGGQSVTESDSWVDKRHLEYWEECIDETYQTDMKAEVSMIPQHIRKELS